MDMYIDEDIIRILKRDFGIEYVEGMKMTRQIRSRIGEILQARYDRGQSLTIGGEDAHPAEQLEEY